MQRLILRPLLIILTLAMLMVALFQSVGRLTFLVLDDLETTANQWLSGIQVELSGLEGRWRMLNPVVMIDRVDLATGYVADVVVEIDWLESLLRNRTVARRLIIGSADLTFEQTPSGRWRIAGSTADPTNFDFFALFYQSDELSFTGKVSVQFEGQSSVEASEPIVVSYRGINSGGVHHHRLSLRNTGSACQEPCQGFAEFQLREGGWLIGESETALRVNAENLRVPYQLGGIEARLNALTIDWQAVGRSSGGRLQANLDSSSLLGETAIGAELVIAVRGEDGIYEGRVGQFELHSNGASLSMPVIRLLARTELSEIWIEHLDLALVADFSRVALRGIEPAERWLSGLNLEGEAFNVHGYLRPDSMEFGYAATLSALNFDGYKGMPTIRGGGGEIIGHSRGALLKLRADDLAFQFPAIFRDIWHVQDVQGSIRGWFDGEYLGLRGSNLRVATGKSRAVGGFALTRPTELYEQRLSLLINVDEMAVVDAKSYIPYKLSPGLRSWLVEGPQGGQLHNARFAYHGQIRTRPGELSRRLELQLRVTDGLVRYHPDWPEVRDLSAELAVAGSNVRVSVESGFSAGARLDGSEIALGQNAAYADVDLTASIATDAAVEYVRASPLHNWLAFVTPEWSGSGQLKLDGGLHIPLKPFQTEAAGDEIAINLAITLTDATLDMPDYRLILEALDGTVDYRYPHDVNAVEITGTMFDRPVLIGADADDDAIVFQIDGQATEQDVLTMIGLTDPGFVRGEFDFLATLTIAMDDEGVSHLDVTSDLDGLELILPAYAKPAAEKRVASITLQFLENYNSLRFQHSDVTGWVHLDDELRRGAIGFGIGPPMVEADAQSVVLAGRITNFALEEVLPGEGGSSNWDIPLRLMNLQVGHIDVGDFQIANAVLNGTIGKETLDLTLESDAVNGTFTLAVDAPLVVNLEQLTFPGSESEDEAVDPLDPSVMDALPEADVTIARLTVGEEDYGSWQFQIRPQLSDTGNRQGVVFENLNADVRGVVVLAPAGVVWNRADNTSRFVGDLSAGNLAEVLPLWDYAVSIETKSALLSGDFVWAGSPPNIELERLIGRAEIRASEGRFLDVESGQGAQRIFSLVNFGAITRRLGGDFSDVTGKGVSFDTIDASVRLTEGQLDFVEPMQVLSTGSDFKIGGTVDLVTGALDNEMIVTLPLSKNLPWYAVLISFGNPLAGLAVLAGERVLRKPLEQLSSAKYSISGTLDDPHVDFVTILGSMSKPDEVDETIETATLVPGSES
ncbi:MAG: DUF3971 domain-containing protein, partial [Gammaproteobacteria bacterium]|nr:DUF3971 domain-containing protein [Gammaproteobacteria bacterium]